MFAFVKKARAVPAEIAALKQALENAKLRITDLTLQNIKQANQIVMLQEYGGSSAAPKRPVPARAREIPMPTAPANSATASLFSLAG